MKREEMRAIIYQNVRGSLGLVTETTEEIEECANETTDAILSVIDLADAPWQAGETTRIELEAAQVELSRAKAQLGTVRNWRKTLLIEKSKLMASLYNAQAFDDRSGCSRLENRISWIDELGSVIDEALGQEGGR
jgi:hypothetical protein